MFSSSSFWIFVTHTNLSFLSFSSIALVSNTDSKISSENGGEASTSGSSSSVIIGSGIGIEPQSYPLVMDVIVENEEHEDITNEGGPSINASATDEPVDESEGVPTNDFCFTHDDFTEYQLLINDATRHQNKHKVAWNEINAM